MNDTNIKSKLLKRVPLDQLMDLKVDYAFKQLKKLQLYFLMLS